MCDGRLPPRGFQLNRGVLRAAWVVVMVHPDHQYDPKVIPDLLEPLKDGNCDTVFGSRMLGGRPIQGGNAEVKVSREHL